MKRKLLLGLLVLASAGCTGGPSTDRGIETGAVVGGITGLGIGALTGRPAEGLLIGAGAGGAIGGIAGAHKDARDQKRYDAAVQAQVARQMSLEEVRDMARSGNSDVVIINQLRTTNSVFNLTPDQVTWLHQVGVTDPVITEMQARQLSPAVYYPRRPVYYVAEPPPVGVAVGIGVR